MTRLEHQGNEEAAAQNPVTRLLRRALLLLARGVIRAYQLFISPLTPPACRYQPTCSAYALEALEVHGPIKGTWLALKRIARCHPIEWLGGRSGYDPVPAPSLSPASGKHACSCEQPSKSSSPEGSNISSSVR